MKGLTAIVGMTALVASVSVLAHKDATHAWPPSLKVEADLDRNGQVDTAELGIAPTSVRLRVNVNSKPLPVIDIPVDGSQQFGICPGSDPTLSIEAQSEAPLNALGETPRGYEICEGCVEIVVSGGACDGLHFYWDTTTNQLAWWRA